MSEEEKPWEVVISSNRCPFRKFKAHVCRLFFCHTCKLSGGTCNYDNCRKRLGPED